MTKETQMIHEDFKKSLEVSTMKVEQIPQVDLSYLKNLREIGAIKSSSIRELEAANKKAKAAKLHNAAVRQLRVIEAQYPQYRIIDYDNVIKLCKKYGLVIGSLTNYKEMIPKQNIKEIASYPVIPHKEYSILKLLFRIGDKYQFLIAAPATFFKEGKVIDNFIIPIERFKLDLTLTFKMPTLDPIVLRELPIEGDKRYFHIVSAWEIEAEDELVTNKITNESSEN